MVDIPLPLPDLPPNIFILHNIKWDSTFLQLCLINSTSPAPNFWTPTPTNLTVRFEWTAYLTGLSTGRYNRRMRWVHSLPSGRKCCLLPGSIPLCYSINHAERRKTVSDYNSQEKKIQCMRWWINTVQNYFKMSTKDDFFSSVLLSSNSKTFKNNFTGTFITF